jgi:hypothetical protein
VGVVTSSIEDGLLPGTETASNREGPSRGDSKSFSEGPGFIATASKEGRTGRGETMFEEEEEAEKDPLSDEPSARGITRQDVVPGDD